MPNKATVLPGPVFVSWVTHSSEDELLPWLEPVVQVGVVLVRTTGGVVVVNETCFIQLVAGLLPTAG